MYCQACGIALSQQMRYCNRCGAQIVPAGEGAVVKIDAEKQLDRYLDGLFWITVFGLVFIFGGMALLNRLNFSQSLILAYVALSSTAFLINFGLSLWRVIHMTRQSQKTKLLNAQATTSELPPTDTASTIGPIPSVTENTTRSFESVYAKRNPE